MRRIISAQFGSMYEIFADCIFLIRMSERFPSMTALLALESAARLGSLTRAADELAITESAVSRRIQQLEAFYGTKLLRRLARGVAVTPDGELLLGTVIDVLQSLRFTRTRLRSGSRRRLKISVAPAIGSLWLAPRLAELQRVLADFDLVIDSTSNLADINAGEADVGVRAGPGAWQDLSAFRLSDERLMMVCSPGYAVAVGGLRRPEDLTRAVFLRNDRLMWRPWFRAAGLRWEEPMEGPTYTDVRAMIEAVLSGQGVALCYESLIGLTVDRVPLQLPFDIATTSPYSYYAVCAKSARERPEIATVIDWATESFKRIRRPASSPAP